MSVPRCSVVVPVIPSHHKYIKALLEELSPARNKIAEIIFCASSQTEVSEQELLDITNDSAFYGIVIIESTRERVTAGANRNVGWNRAKGDYICFLDADDSYNPHMFNIFEYYFENLGCDLILHDYFRFAPHFLLRKNRSLLKVKVINSDVLFRNTFGEIELRGEVVSYHSENTNIVLPLQLRFLHRIQHGHATVKRNIPLRYSNKTVGEDGEFAQRVLLGGYRVIYLPLRLSNYDRPTLSNLCNSLSLRFIERLSKAKNAVIFRYRYLLGQIRARWKSFH